MTRTSIFGTERPDLGTVINFDTPGQNETQLDEDKFEQEIINYFQKHSCISGQRVFHIAGLIMGNGEISDYFTGITRADDLMISLTVTHPESYKKVSKGYITLDKN